jgi:hypothetical protein
MLNVAIPWAMGVILWYKFDILCGIPSGILVIFFCQMDNIRQIAGAPFVFSCLNFLKLVNYHLPVCPYGSHRYMYRSGVEFTLDVANRKCTCVPSEGGGDKKTPQRRLRINRTPSLWQLWGHITWLRSLLQPAQRQSEASRLSLSPQILLLALLLVLWFWPQYVYVLLHVIVYLVHS